MNMATKKTPAKISAPSIVGDDMSWRARDDMHTLKRAREVEADRKRFMAAQREAVKEMKILQTVTKKK